MRETTSDGESAAFSYDAIEEPHAFIQWKGTNVCMDFHCECGAHCHFDGDFAYVVQCPHCMTKWEMPFHLFPRKIVAGSHGERWHAATAKMMEMDEDHE